MRMGSATLVMGLPRAAVLGLLALLPLLTAHPPEPAQRAMPDPTTPTTSTTARAVLPFPPGDGPFQRDAARLDLPPATPGTGIPDDWYAQVTQNIAESEYHINWQEHANAFQSPNRQQDLRITYHADGFSLKPRVADSLWNVSLTLDRIGREGAWLVPANDASVAVNEASLVADHGAFAIDYHNGKEGMRQNFTVRQRPSGAGPLEVRLNYTGDLHAADKGGNAIAFCQPVEGTDSYTPVLWYKDLHVWDANGDTLPAKAGLEGNEIVLAVVDDGAEYPITVDPLSTTADWSTEVNQANAFFGFSVSSAGDVNGDGYSDVIIGAHGYDNFQVDAGRAYVYHGSATGLSATANWQATVNQAGAAFGYSVSNAGDVNGDGFGDVIIGVRLYDNGQPDEGRAVVYHGSATGLGAANWSVESNQANAQMGYSVAAAGDVNGDGYSDVIVGIWLDDYSIFTNHGRASVFHGSATGLSPTSNWSTVGNQNNAQLGISVAGAGDVNGDGYSDVIVGADLFDNGQTNEGRAWVFHGSATGLLPVPAWTAEANQANASFGTSVSTAGDVNGDGYSDVIVGAPGFGNGQAFEGRAFVYLGSASGLNATTSWTAEADQASASFGYSVACAGDVNGDGFADVLVGAYLYDNGQTDEGRAYLYEGSATGLAATASWTTESDQASAYMGGSVSSAGDVNGDGYSDVLIGLDGYDNGQANEGRASVFHGSAAGLAATAAWTAESDQASAYFGTSVSSAGDVNGDGYSDVIVGADAYDNGQTNAGRAFVYHGSATGLAASAAWTAESDQASAYFGTSVSSAGDVNGDGYSDVIIGAELFDNGQSSEGRAVVYHGSATGLGPTAAWIAESDQAFADFGTSVSSAGDVNGDGYSDVIVGANSYTNGQVDEGAAFVYHGSAKGLAATAAWTAESDQASAQFGWSVSSAGDVNGDGYSDVIVGAFAYDNGQTNAGRAYVYHGSATGLAASAAWTAESDQPAAWFGYSVSSAGDVNGDGYSDVIVGADAYDNGQTNAGRAFVYHGSATGLGPTAAWTAESDQVYADFGYSVSSAGDVNGDGYSDVIVGAPYFDNGQSGEGRAFVYHGSATGLAATAAWTAESDQASAYFGYSVSSAGDVNGDGYSDVIVGAPNFDNGQTDEGRAYVYHGNNGTGRRHNLRLYNTNLTSPIGASNIPNNQFGAGLYAKPFLGRQRVRMVWETRIQGQPFSSAGGRITNSTAYTAQQAASTQTALAGTELKSLVDKLTSTYPITATKVRARLRYPLATALTGQVYGPWRYMPGYLDGHGTHNNIPLPVEMLWMEAACEAGTPTLAWATATEHNNAHFVIERSSDAQAWQAVGQVEGAGDSQQVIEYTWRDGDPVGSGTVYYRLRQVDRDGHEEVLATLPLEACGTAGAEMVVLPNPTDGPVEVRWAARDGSAGIRELRLLDADGRMVRAIRTVGEGASANLDLGGLSPGHYTIMGVDGAGATQASVRVVRR